MSSRTVLITGGCGFIGANLCRLLADDYRIIVFDNLSRGSKDYLDGIDVEVIQGDILDRDAIFAAAKEADVMVHLAAYGSVVESVADPMTNFRINAEGTVNVADAARSCDIDKLVFASTGGALIGNATPPVSESSLPKPISPYGASKLVGEAYLNAFANAYGLRTIATRFANVYGPVSAHKKGAITVFIRAIFEGKPIHIFGDGSASRDFLHVTDLCRGIRLGLETDTPAGEVVHLASGRETTVRELASLLTTVAGVPDHPIEFAEARPGEVQRNFARYDYANEILGFAPRIRLEDGLKQTWDWFVEHKQEFLDTTQTDS